MSGVCFMLFVVTVVAISFLAFASEKIRKRKVGHHILILCFFAFFPPCCDVFLARILWNCFLLNELLHFNCGFFFMRVRVWEGLLTGLLFICHVITCIFPFLYFLHVGVSFFFFFGTLLVRSWWLVETGSRDVVASPPFLILSRNMFHIFAQLSSCSFLYSEAARQ